MGVLLETEEENELWKYVKAADKLSALIKCLEEEDDVRGKKICWDSSRMIRTRISSVKLHVFSIQAIGLCLKHIPTKILFKPLKLF